MNIPNLNWDTYTAGVERVGWCGEVSIQMIALHYGYYHSQKTINQLGKPKHLDLYSDEIESVMKLLGFDYSFYINERGQDVGDYIRWVKHNLANRIPVFSGVKRNPSGNPNWYLDHFVVLTGYDKWNIFYNSNNRNHGEVVVEESLFLSSSKPYNLKNSSNFYFGIAVDGINLHDKNKPNSHPVRLLVLGETEDKVNLGIRVQDLLVGQQYTLSRHRIDMDSKRTVIDSSELFVASKDTMTFKHLVLDKHESYFYTIENTKLKLES
ncbi:hypothetical protein L4C38_18370 [Vibrio kasasachensis]|uniref:hypothetical protein n=1 Tax=Vibrio kasasachensis TaxID=2910248 RepID=UPI003D0C8C37